MTRLVLRHLIHSLLYMPTTCRFGHTIRSQSVKDGAALKYLLATATLLSNFDTIPWRYGRKKFRTNQSVCNDTIVVLRGTRRYPFYPNRREAFTLAMQQALRTACQYHGPHSLKFVLANWLAAGPLGGFQKHEYHYENKSVLVGSCNQSPSGDPTTVTLASVK